MAPESSGDLRVPPGDWLGAAPRRRRDRVRALDGVEGASPGWPLPAAACGEGAGEQVRVALPRRPAAHGHKPLRTFPAPRPRRDRRSFAALARLDAPRNEGRLRLHPRDRRRPLPDRVRRGHDDETAATVTGFVERALADFAQRGITARRLMTDNASPSAEPLAARAARRPRDPAPHHQPYRPRTNGKVERFHQTMAREWAYGLAYRTHHDRTAALPHWLHHYNTSGHTARSETDPRSAAFTTSVGRTPRPRRRRRAATRRRGP